jgi:hypothetical protein
VARESVDRFHFDPEALRAVASAHAPAYAGARPFPHAILDDVVPAAVADAAAAEFATLDTDGWLLHTDRGNSLKRATPDETKMGTILRGLVSEFNSQAFVAFLEELTGIEGLIPDPHLAGGGLHQLDPGGFLNVHADFNRHSRLRLDRRVNVLWYLNPGWRPEWGGALELWDEEMRDCVVRAEPVHNRMVVFNTTSTSFHGNPQPVACPEGNARRSVALYYYSNGRPRDEHTAAHSTLYRRAAGEETRVGRVSERARALARDLVPPVLMRAIRRRRHG